MWARRADEEARRALAQDGALAEAHLAIASAAGTPYGGFDWKILLDRSATALALDPSLELAHLTRMRAFYHLGLFDDAAREGREATTLNQSHSVEFDRLEVALLLFDGRFGAAIGRGGTLLTRTDAPAVLNPSVWGASTLAMRTVGGRCSGRLCAEIVGIFAPRLPCPRLRPRAARPREARNRITEIVRSSVLNHHVAYSLGAASAQLREPAASLEWLERSADTAFPATPAFERDRLLDPIRMTRS